MVHLDFDHMNLPAGAGSTLDGAASCRASKGRASDKGRGRAGRGTVRHERSCCQSRRRPCRSRLGGPVRAHREQLHWLDTTGADPDGCSSWSTTSSPRRGDAACSTAANLMLGRQPPMERRADMMSVPETRPSCPARTPRFSVDPAPCFRPFQNRLIAERRHPPGWRVPEDE